MSREETPDEELILRISRGDREAIRLLYQRHGRLVYGCAVQVVSDAAAAEEVCQDVFLRVWERSGTYQADKGKVVTWLARIARNRRAFPTHHITTLKGAPSLSRHGQERANSCSERFSAFDDLLRREDPDFKVFTHRSGNQKGSFAVFVEPTLTQGETEKQETDMVFVLDRSGSVGGGALEQSKTPYDLDWRSCRGSDRFNVITIGSRVEKLADRLMSVTSDNITKAVRFVNLSESEGGTDLYERGYDSAGAVFLAETPRNHYICRRRPAYYRRYRPGSHSRGHKAQ